MDCPEKRVDRDRRVRIVHKSWKKNWLVYKSVGCEVKAQLRVKKRRWWCGFLCKTWGWKSWRADQLGLGASFFGDLGLLEQQSKSGQDISKLKIRHFAIGLPTIKVDPYKREGSVGLPDAASLVVKGVQSNAAGSVDAWMYFDGLIIKSDQLSGVPGAEEIGSVQYQGCTGAGKQD